MSQSNRPSHGPLLALAVAALLLYAPWIGWGLPHATAPDRTKTYATDELLPLEALAEMQSTFVASQPGRNYAYPWWHYFVLAAAQAPYLAALWAAGELSSPSGTFPFGLSDPVRALEVLTLIGRAVSVLMGAGIVVAAYLFGRALWGAAVGLATAVLTLPSYLMVYYGRTGNLEVPAFFWSSLGMVCFARILACGASRRRCVGLGIFAGLAVATKDQSALMFVPLGAVLLLPGVGRFPDAPGRLAILVPGLAAAVVAYAVGIGAWIDPARHWTHVGALLFEPERLTVASAYHPPYPRGVAGAAGLVVETLRRAADAFSLPVAVAALAGVARAARRCPDRLWLLLPLAALFFGLLLPTRHVVLRYYLPFTLIVCAFAAYALVGSPRGASRRAGAVAVALICGFQLLVAADLSYAQANETRSAAGRWLAAHARPGDRIEYFGPAQKLPPLSAAVRSRRIAGRERWRGQRGHGPAVLDYLRSQGPEYVLVIPDWTTPPGADHSGDCPSEVRAALADGSVGYREVAAFDPPALLSGPLRRPPLDSPSVSPPVHIFARADVAER